MKKLIEISKNKFLPFVCCKSWSILLLTSIVFLTMLNSCSSTQEQDNKITGDSKNITKFIPGLYWSIFHPVPPDVNYMEEVIKKADIYGVESFEMAGHSNGPTGDLEGVLLYEDYPEAMAYCDKEQVLDTRKKLNRIVELSHNSGRKFIYWHREVRISKGIVESVPEILDEKGEIDFNSEVYWQFVRNKIRGFFKAVPGIDGLVLTLTESDYSVIHNSDPDRYPPVEIAARLIRTFSEELEALGKSLTFRTFGSIDEDYRVLSAAAKLALKDCAFEIETKVTPYDWSLFLPDNPYLKHTENASLAAEFDLLGEYFGLGELPCLYTDLLVKEVRYARKRGATRFPGRIDRWNRKVIESVNEMNLFTFSQALKNPKVTSDEIWQDWAEQEWGEAGADLIPIMKTSVDLIRKSFYIDGHMFSQNYRYSVSMMMLGGIFSIFEPGVSLESNVNLWSMFYEKTSPGNEAIVKEKEEAVAIADQGFKSVSAMAERIPEQQRDKIITAWHKATFTTRIQLASARIIIAYFEDMKSNAGQPLRMEQAIKESLVVAGSAKKTFPSGIVTDMANTMYKNAEVFREIYAAEFAARSEWQEEKNLVDYLVCGGFLDEWRVKRYMHGSGFELLDNRPVRWAGNNVFPNGFLEYTLYAKSDKVNELLIRLHGSGGSVKVIINDEDMVVEPSVPDGFCTIIIPVTPDHNGKLRVRMEKAGATPPKIGGLGVRRSD